MATIKMGQYVKCRITDFEGTVTSLTKYLQDASKAGVQPKGDGKSIPDSMDIDTTQLDVVTDSDGLSIEDYDQRISFGSKVRCKLTGYEGITYGICWYMNGCVRYGVQPKHDKKKEKLDKGSWFADTTLEVLSKEDVKVKQSRTGGPIMKSRKD